MSAFRACDSHCGSRSSPNIGKACREIIYGQAVLLEPVMSLPAPLPDYGSPSGYRESLWLLVMLASLWAH